MQTKLFVHIPKTAGTSFRLAAEVYFGNDAICYDYGIDSPQTSDECVKYVYNDNDIWGLYRSCSRHHVKLVAGHYYIQRYIDRFGACNTITFIRDPIQRTISEYLHFLREKRYTGSFADFYRRPTMQNKLSRFLHKVPIEAIGFVGLTERYIDSLTLINHKFSWKLKSLEKNIAINKLSDSHDISDDDLGALSELNQDDLILYNSYLELFDQRWELFLVGAPFAHAKMTGVTRSKVTGWAWWDDCSDSPVEIEVYINEQCVGSVFSLEFRKGLSWFRPPRGSYVGFSLPICAKEGDEIQCRVRKTGQLFPLTPYRVK